MKTLPEFAVSLRNPLFPLKKCFHPSRSGPAVRLLTVSLLWLWLAGRGLAATGPDLTTVDLSSIDRTMTYNLGPTGLRGWIFTFAASEGERNFNRFTSHQPWQILVTAVGTNTPAQGIMAVNDVILGVSAGAANVPVTLFSQDARKSMGLAIGAAEAGDGILRIKRWRAGTTTDVQINLPVLGAYTATAPYNCPKSALILSNAVRVLNTSSFDGPALAGPVLGLALLASGDASLLPKVQTYARQLGLRVANYQPGGQINSWTYALRERRARRRETGDLRIHTQERRITLRPEVYGKAAVQFRRLGP